MNKVECDGSTATELGVRWEVKSFQEKTIVLTETDGGTLENLDCLLVRPNLKPQNLAFDQVSPWTLALEGNAGKFIIG